MNRKEFIKSCGFSCLGSSVVTLLMHGCGLSKTLSGTIQESDLLVSLSDFETRTGNQIHYKKYIVVNNDTLKFPICIYRTDAQNYSALWLQCTHQGAELQVFGDKLLCPAHGSEFDYKGMAVNGPAYKNLRSFPVLIEGNHLKISLKKSL